VKLSSEEGPRKNLKEKWRERRRDESGDCATGRERDAEGSPMVETKGERREKEEDMSSVQCKERGRTGGGEQRVVGRKERRR